MQELEKRIIEIEKRNKRVELEKAWETSKTRSISILAITYIFATIALWIIGISEPHINSIIPTLGYFLSIQSLPFIKKIWINKK